MQRVFSALFWLAVFVLLSFGMPTYLWAQSPVWTAAFRGAAVSISDLPSTPTCTLLVGDGATTRSIASKSPGATEVVGVFARDSYDQVDYHVGLSMTGDGPTRYYSWGPYRARDLLDAFGERAAAAIQARIQDMAMDLGKDAAQKTALYKAALLALRRAGADLINAEKDARIARATADAAATVANVTDEKIP